MKKILSAFVALAFLAVAVPAIAEEPPAGGAAPTTAPAGEKTEKKSTKKAKKAKKAKKDEGTAAPAK